MISQFPNTPKIKVLLLSPLPPPVGGISTWTTQTIIALEAENRVEVVLIDTAVKYRRLGNVGLIKRIAVGLFQFIEHI